MPITLATQKAEIRRITIHSQPGQTVHKTQKHPKTLKNTQKHPKQKNGGWSGSSGSACVQTRDPEFQHQYSTLTPKKGMKVGEKQEHILE
jgi:hypothetical protein